ncbi:hypothetical protein [Microcoleus sp. CAWBG58]|uniref:hypothetical protein n=1 Tax=Microcoleus sp. CAWBG58 TaxID=2841651 RepID=UPI0025EE34EE|nr:hypothetical protein [Microcoleus sp. CAWBG58]
MTEVKREVNLRLTQSLGGIEAITLEKSLQPEQVQRPCDVDVKVGERSTEALPSDTTILSVFERVDIQGLLLILGKPGSGKTTVLLNLTQSLTQKAESSPTAPIPVIFNLSSWQNCLGEIKDWLEIELSFKYGVRADISREWIEKKQLLPMLDGLDEVEAGKQADCVREINKFLKSECRPSYLVVCSRQEEYEAYPDKLRLSGAVCLQEMSDKQIEDHLTRIEKQEIWEVLQQDKVLLDLARKPLFLYVIVLSYDALSFKQLREATSSEMRLSILWEAYIQRMLDRELQSNAYSERKRPSAQNTAYWLTILAQQLQHKSQTEFLLERMQISHLTEELRESVNFYVGFLDLLALYLFPITTLVTILSLCYESYGTYLGAVFSILLAILTSYLADNSGKLTKPVEKLSWSWKEFTSSFWPVLGIGLVLGLIGGLSSSIVGEMVSSTSINKGFVFGIGHFFSMTLSIMIPFLFLGTSSEKPRFFWATGQQWFDSIIASLIFGLFFGIIIGLIVSLSSGLLGRISDSIVLGIFYGSFDAILSRLLDIVIFGFVFGIVISLVSSLIASLKGLEIDLKLSSNQGIWNSLTNSVRVGLLCFLIFSVSGTLIFGVTLGSIFGLIGAWLGGLIGGSVIFVRHFTLRACLYLKGYIPWDYTRFLDYSTDRLFLQRVGGHYRFIHKLLQEYFVSCDVASRLTSR